jgi:hypothetical protein
MCPVLIPLIDNGAYKIFQNHSSYFHTVTLQTIKLNEMQNLYILKLRTYISEIKR